MPKTILDLAKEKKDKVSTDRAEAGQNVQLAVAAIIGGIKSPAWRSYMMQFVDQNVPGVPVEPAQLERLLARCASGELATRIHAVVPLEHVADAHRAVAKGGVRGRYVLTP